jgi:3-methyladenine DNA glycosylase AlkD
MNLFEDTPFAYNKCLEWSTRSEEFVKRASFVLIARLAVSDKKAIDRQFIRFLPLIRREASDERNFVKKAVNWALRQIGKRNLTLNRQAIKVGKELRRLPSKSAQWIASDALRELTNEKILKRLRLHERRP